MRSLVQRVSQASVTVDGQVVGAIGHGMLVLVGVEVGDTPVDVARHVAKLTKLRIFEDTAGKMNLDIAQAQGGFLVVSQFTLAGDCRKGNRPGFDRAMPPQDAKRLYDDYVAQLRETSGCPVDTGVFGAHMDVRLANDGPVTLLLENL